MDISKEVESALEEEGYVKIDSTSPSTMTSATLTSPISASDQTTSLSAGSSLQSQPVNPITSPVQQQIRPDISSSDISAGRSSTDPSSSSSSLSTWQEQHAGGASEDGQFGGVWGWMSSAVSAGLQTTQNLGRNIVEKTKVHVLLDRCKKTVNYNFYQLLKISQSEVCRTKTNKNVPGALLSYTSM